MKVVIGISGVKGSGKNTVAELIRKVDTDFVEEALANKIKETCSFVFGFEYEYFDDQALKNNKLDKPIKLWREDVEAILEHYGIKDSGKVSKIYKKVKDIELDTYRKILQIVGTEVLREGIDRDIHCKSVHIFDKTIITDIRFRSEFDFFMKLHEKGEILFFPIYIHNKRAESRIDIDKSHKSEREVFTFLEKCYTINNNHWIGVVEPLEDQIKRMLEVLEEKKNATS